MEVSISAKWWHSPEHPIWRIALVLACCVGAAWMGAQDFDRQDVMAVMAGAGAGWAFGPAKR